MEFFDIYGTHIPISEIKDFRIIDVEFVFRPVYREVKKTVINTLAGKKFEFDSMQPYAAIIGQEGHKSALGEYKAKDFKEALGKDLSGAVIYTIADKLKLKAFKRQKYQCQNLGGRSFTTYLDDIPVMITWNDGRIAEVFKEDALYTSLGDITPHGIQYIPALVIVTNESFVYYGNGIQVSDVNYEYQRLVQALEDYRMNKGKHKLLGTNDKTTLSQVLKLPFSAKHMNHTDSNL